jgi:hypothetical protein
MGKKITNKIYEEFWTEPVVNITESESEIKPKKKKVSKKKKEENSDEIIIINSPEITVEEVPIIKNDIERPLTEKEFYNKYISDGEPFKIYFRGNIIYDSIMNIDKPIFEDNYFILFKKNYIYRGIRIEKY